MGRLSLFTPAAMGQGETQLVSNLYRMDYFYAKIRLSKTKNNGELHYTSPVIPSCDNARQWPLGLWWWELMYGRKNHKPQKFVKNPFPPIHTHTQIHNQLKYYTVACKIISRYVTNI